MCEVLGLVPLIVIVYAPPADVLLDTVIVDEPPAVTDDGLKLTVVPGGWPEAVRSMLSAVPAVTVVEIVDVPDWPWSTVRLLGLAAIEKSFAGGGGGGGGGCDEQLGNLKEPIRVRQFRGRLIPALTIFLQRLADDGIQVAAEDAVDRAQSRRRLFPDRARVETLVAIPWPGRPRNVKEILWKVFRRLLWDRIVIWKR